MDPELQALGLRWDTFLGKVSGRMETILAEAGAGFDQLIAMLTTDPIPFTSAEAAVRSRFLGLQQKIDEAWETFDDELDEARENLEDKALSLADRLFDELHAKGQALQATIEARAHELIARKGGDVARRIHATAQEELAQQQSACAHCGAPVEPPLRHLVSKAACTHCGAVNTVRPGPATTYFYSGGLIRWLAEEAALPQWQAMKQAEARFNATRPPVPQAVFERLEQTTESYWRAQAEIHGQLHPDWDRDRVEQEVRSKMGGFYLHHKHDFPHAEQRFRAQGKTAP